MFFTSVQQQLYYVCCEQNYKNYFSVLTGSLPHPLPQIYTKGWSKMFKVVTMSYIAAYGIWNTWKPHLRIFRNIHILYSEKYIRCFTSKSAYSGWTLHSPALTGRFQVSQCCTAAATVVVGLHPWMAALRRTCTGYCGKITIENGRVFAPYLFIFCLLIFISTIQSMFICDLDYLVLV